MCGYQKKVKKNNSLEWGISKEEFEKWLAICASVGGVGGVLAWVTYLRVWRASVDDVGGVLAWMMTVAC